VVVTARDCANAVTTHIADVALRHMLAVRQGQPPPKVEETTPVKPEVARKLAGRYRCGNRTIDLRERSGKLWGWPGRGGFGTELRASGDALIVDGLLDFGTKIVPQGDKLRIGKDLFERVAVPRPEPPPARWAGLIGEYGWDHNTLYILEKDGRLH